MGKIQTFSRLRFFMSTPPTQAESTTLPSPSASQAVPSSFWRWFKIYGAIFLVFEVMILIFFVGLSGEKSQQKAMLREAEQLRNKGQHVEALAILVKFGEQWPGALKTQNFNRRIGEYYLDAEEPEKAAEHLEESIKLNPNIPGGWAKLGEALWKAGKLEAAVEQFSLELEKGNQDNDLAHYYLGRFYFEKKSYKEAFNHFAAIKETFPQYTELDTYRREFIQVTLKSDEPTSDSITSKVPLK